MSTLRNSNKFILGVVFTAVITITVGPLSNTRGTSHISYNHTLISSTIDRAINSDISTVHVVSALAFNLNLAPAEYCITGRSTRGKWHLEAESIKKAVLEYCLQYDRLFIIVG
jgi:hypothetical protein